jgi:hypothetical protein
MESKTSPVYPELLGRTPRYPPGDVITRERLSAVFVPSHRSPGQSGDGLGLAALVAQMTGAQLIVARSGEACAEPYPEYMSPTGAPDALVIDFSPAAIQHLPAFASDQHQVAVLHRTSDVSLKRNIFLLLGILTGWQLTLMLDDDIKLEPPGETLRESANELRLEDVSADFANYPNLHVAGFMVREFNDLSVFRHARTLVGDHRDGFLGAGAVFLRCSRLMPFFPEIYNSDWSMLFPLISTAQHYYPSSAVKIVGTLHQSPYDPFLTARAQSEELGEIFIEGVYDLLRTDRHRRSAVAGSREYWVQILRSRRTLILDTLVKLDLAVAEHGQDICGRASAAVQAGFAVYSELEDPARDLAEYFRLWCHDLAKWRTYIDQLCREAGNRPVSIQDAISLLGLNDSAHWVKGSTTI